jgi:CDP-diacylglycerol--inositol 3-phosphatidyltransferase
MTVLMKKLQNVKAPPEDTKRKKKSKGTFPRKQEHTTTFEVKGMGANRIFLYAPNLIGYARVTLSLVSFCIFDTMPHLVLILYTLSFVLDALDGYVARALNQCSRLGAVLDMVTDRFSTAALCTILAILFHDSSYAKIIQVSFIFLNILDFVSHWLRMYVSLVVGSASHKNLSQNSPALLKLYYGNRKFMGLLCVGNELFYVLLFAMKNEIYIVPTWFFHAVVVPLWAMKQLMNLIQLYQSALDLVEWEYEHDLHHKKQ